MINPNIPLSAQVPKTSLDPFMNAVNFQDQRTSRAIADKTNLQNKIFQKRRQEREDRKRGVLSDLMKSNIRITPEGPTLDKKGFLAGMMDQGLTEEAVKYGQELEKEEAEKQQNFLNTQKIKQQAKQDILKTEMPILRGLKDTSERARVLRDAYKQWKMDPSWIPDEITDDMLNAWEQEAAAQERYGVDPKTFINPDTGETRSFQLGSLGGVREVDFGLGEGFVPAGRLMKEDTGGGIRYRNPFTSQPIGEPSIKTPKPEQMPDFKRRQAEATAAGSLAGKGEIQLTAGEKKRDQVFGTWIANFISEGGASDMEKGLSQLRQVENALENKKNITGKSVGLTPSFALDFVNPDAANVKQLVEEVVQRNLRQVLGAQFTEREGVRLIERAYNPRLGPEKNLERVKRLAKQMRRGVEARKKAIDHFNKEGTLQGFDSKNLFNSADDFSFEDDAPGNSRSTIPTDEQIMNMSPEELDEFEKSLSR